MTREEFEQIEFSGGRCILAINRREHGNEKNIETHP